MTNGGLGCLRLPPRRLSAQERVHPASAADPEHGKDETTAASRPYPVAIEGHGSMRGMLRIGAVCPKIL